MFDRYVQTAGEAESDPATGWCPGVQIHAATAEKWLPLAALPGQCTGQWGKCVYDIVLMHACMGISSDSNGNS